MKKDKLYDISNNIPGLILLLLIFVVSIYIGTTYCGGKIAYAAEKPNPNITTSYLGDINGPYALRSGIIVDKETGINYIYMRNNDKGGVAIIPRYMDEDTFYRSK